MLIQYESNVKSTIVFLRLLGIKVNNKTVNETLLNHPEWPSMLCITDSLHKWNIPNAAGKINIEDIDLLPVPFITRIIDIENPMTIVTKISETHVFYHSYKKNKSISILKDDFSQKWDGVYLIAEPNNESGEKNYNKVKRKTLFQNLIPFTLSMCLIILSFWRLQTTYGDIFESIVFLQFLIYLIGILITSLLLWYEIDRNNPLLKKVCTGMANGDCEAILTSSHAKFLNWLSWSEIGFFYFTGGLLSLIFLPDSISTLAWLSLLAMPYIFFSIYFQWRVVRQWCVLCLSIQVLLLTNGIITLTKYSSLSINLSTYLTLKVTSCFIVPALIWYSVKPFCLQLQLASSTRREYLRFKSNMDIFDTLLKKQKAISLPDANNIGIDIGKSEALHTLIKVCNPYCGPCAVAHPKIDKLLAISDKIKVKIIFTTPDDDMMSKPAKHLMAIAEENTVQLTQKALNDWYLADEKNYDVFAVKHPINGSLHEQNHKTDMMNKWCREMQILGTPTFFFDGNELPDAYNIEDLEYFLLE